MNAVNWVKTHKALTALIVVGGWLLWSRWYGAPGLMLRSPSFTDSFGYGTTGVANSSSISSKSTSLPPYNPSTPQTESSNRLVTKNSSLGIVVKNVRETQDKIVQQAESNGGYMVQTSLNYPEEAPYAQIVLRVPSEKLNQTVTSIRGFAVKVTSESVYGQDVTDQYVDIQAQIDSLTQTKTRYEDIRQKTEAVDQLVAIQRELTNVQTQIDSLIGRQKYLEQTAKLSLVTVDLSTDELALPYAPTETFRPALIFKLAVRSLVSTLRSFAAFLIWAAVYALIWGPLLSIYLYWNWKKKQIKASADKKNVRTNNARAK